VNYHLVGPDQWLARQNLAPGAISAPESVRGIEIVRTLAKNYFQAGALGMSHTESQLQFFLGHTAMIPCGAWLKSEMLGKIPDGFEMGCFNLPRTEPTKGEPTAVFAQVEPFIVFQTTPERTAAAIDFLRFMTSRKMAGRFTKLQDIPTAVRGANEGNLSADLADLTRVVAEAKVSFGLIPGEGYPELQQVYNDMMYDAIATNTPAEQVARKFEQVTQGIRNQAENPDRYAVRHVWKPIALAFLLGGGAILFVVRSARDWRRRADVRGRAAISDASLQRMGWGNVLLFVGPSVAVYTLFVILPSLRSFSWSLHQWNGLTDMESMPFKGLLNFKRLLLESNDFWTAINNNLFLMVVVPLFVIPLAMFLAATISRGVWGAKLFRIVFFFPNLIGGVAATLLWMHLYNPKGGLINTALAGVGTGFAAIGLDAVGGWFQAFDGYAWLEPKNLYWSLIPVSIWGTVGFNMVLYLAAMESIDESYYEAATLDGAGPLRQFFTITLPLIWEILAISLVFLIIGGMKAFEIIWLLTNQQPNTDTHVVGTYLVQSMFKEFQVGQATALAVMLFLMIFIGTAATLRGMKRETVEL
jgi:raffinose/stachyose/melibiose transport system permease protein